MDIQKIIKYHEEQLEYNTDMNNQFKNFDKWQKIGKYKDVYSKSVIRYRKKIKFHREALQKLKECAKCLEH